MELSTYLKQVLEERERSIGYMARKTGLAPSTIHRILHGDKDISLKTAQAIAKFCGVDVAYIYGLVDDEVKRKMGLEGRLVLLMDTYPWFKETMEKLLGVFEKEALSLDDLKGAMRYALMALERIEKAGKEI